ncbi:MAG: Cache 3/Cache 2 fusion domain-containing protein [Caldilineaceae bacterium]
MSLIQHVKTQSIRFKLVGLGLASILMTAATMIAVGAWQTTNFAAVTEDQVDTLIEKDLTYVAQGVYNLIKAQDESVQQTVGHNLNVARHVLAQYGSVTLSDERAEWNAINQYTQAANQESLPQMTVGGVWLGHDADMATPVIDDIVGLVGGTATIFQRINERGDMLRCGCFCVEDRRQPCNRHLHPRRPRRAAERGRVYAAER